MSKSPNNNSDQWLIKSANRVMGPFKLIEVITGLQLKHFTVMDEIAAPYGRWTLVRDEQALQAAVKDIRNRADSIENTATLTQTMTSTMTHSINTSSTEVGDNDAPPPFPGDLNPRLLKDPKLLAQVEKRSTNFVFGLVLVLLAAGAGTYFFLNKRKLKESSQDGVAQALQLKAQGFYDRAFAALTKLKATDKDNPAIDLEIGIYQISIQNQNVLGRKSIERIIPQLDPTDGLAEAHTAVALSYMNENDFKSASDAIGKALTANGTFVPALINKAILSFKTGNPERAEQDFEPVIGQVNNGVVVLGSTIASLEVSRKGVMPMRIMPVLVQMLDEYLKANFEYQQEILALKAYIYNSLNKPQQRLEAITQLLQSDLESGQSHRFDPLVDRSILNWRNILPYCQTAIEAFPKDVLNRSFLAYCLSKSGNDLEAKKVITEVEVEMPRNPYVAAIKAYIMRSLGNDSEARASLGLALGQKELLSAWLLKAKYCELDRNDSCVQEALTNLMDINPRSLPAYVGMARLEARRGNKKAAQDWVARGQSLSQTYMPLWELKNTL